MLRKLFLLVFLTILSSTCFANTQQILLGDVPATFSSLGTVTHNYWVLYNTGSVGLSQASPNVGNLFPIGGWLTNLRVNLSAAPGAGKSYNFTVYDGGDTSLTTGNITGTTIGQDLTHSVHVNSGDIVLIDVLPTSSPGAATASWSVTFIPDIDNTVVMGGGGTGTPSNGSFAPIMGADGTGTTFQRSYIVIPCAGTFQNMTMTVATPLGSGQTLGLALYKNGSATNLEPSLGATGTTNTDTTHTIAVLPGDLVAVETLSTGTQPSQTFYAWGVQFIPNIKGYFPIAMQDSNSQWTNNANTYNPVSGRGFNETTANESITQNVISSSIYLYGIYVYAQTAPGANKTFTLSLRDNLSSPIGTPTCQLGGASNVSTCNNLILPITIRGGDLINTQIVPASTPGTQTTGSVTYLAYLDPQVNISGTTKISGTSLASP